MMTQVAGYLLAPALPEIFLACMAMLLLLIGAYLGVGVTKLILGLAIFSADLHRRDHLPCCRPAGSRPLAAVLC